MNIFKFGAVFCMLILIVLASSAASPLQEPSATNWQDVFKAAIMVIVALAGSPITQLLKNALKIEARMALLLTGVVSAGIAVLELWLSHVLVFSTITVDNFPNVFFTVFSVATIYYGLLKGSESVFGKKLLLKPLQSAGPSRLDF